MIGGIRTKRIEGYVFTVAEILGVPLLASAEPAAKYTMSAHLYHQLYLKGITEDQVRAVLRTSAVVTPARGDGNQRRFATRNLVVIVDDSKKLIVTVYPNKVNPLRQDQRSDPRAMAWARKNGLAA